VERDRRGSQPTRGDGYRRDDVKFRVYFERQITQQSFVDVDVEEEQEDSETGYMVRHLAKKAFDPKDAEWTTVDDGPYPTMLDAEDVTHK
jgi:hypothetical protein